MREKSSLQASDIFGLLKTSRLDLKTVAAAKQGAIHSVQLKVYACRLSLKTRLIVCVGLV